MSEDPLPGEIRPPGAEPPGGAGEGVDDDQREGGAHDRARGLREFEPLRAHGKDQEPPGVGPGSIPDDEAGPIGIFPSWAWVYGTVIAWASFLILLLYVFTITFDFSGR